MAGRPPHKPKRAKVFWTGRSQPVRLPKAYRFEGDEVMAQGLVLVTHNVREFSSRVSPSRNGRPRTAAALV
jgi:hypothetical protein